MSASLPLLGSNLNTNDVPSAGKMMTMQQLMLGDICVDVVHKNVKNLNLSVHPPQGRVHISAPAHMELETVRMFALSKLGWIKAQRKKMLEQPREIPREFLERESHYLWGKRYLLEICEHNAPPKVTVHHRKLRLSVRPHTDPHALEQVLEAWYRQQLRAKAETYIDKWQDTLGVNITRLYVRRMKTKWGSCTSARRSIRLNTELAKKPPVCLEYVVLHELAHLIEPSHNARFTGILDRHMPNWRTHQDELNRLPIVYKV